MVPSALKGPNKSRLITTLTPGLVMGVLFTSIKRGTCITKKCYTSRRAWCWFRHAYNPNAGETDCWTPEVCWTDSPAKSVSSGPGKFESLSRETRWTALGQLTTLRIGLWTPYICTHMCRHTHGHKLTHTHEKEKKKKRSILNPILKLKRQSSLGNSGHSLA